MYSTLLCSLSFSWICQRQNIISSVTHPNQKPHCVSGSTKSIRTQLNLSRITHASSVPATKSWDIQVPLWLSHLHVTPVFVEIDYCCILKLLEDSAFFPNKIVKARDSIWNIATKVTSHEILTWALKFEYRKS